MDFLGEISKDCYMPGGTCSTILLILEEFSFKNLIKISVFEFLLRYFYYFELFFQGPEAN